MADYVLDTAMTEEAEKKFSRKLRQKEKVNLIIEGSAGEKQAYFEELIFTAKYLMGILRASAKKEFSGSDLLNKEITESIYKLKDILKIILGDKYGGFETTYFSNDSESFINLTALASDLELLKLYLNDIKRES